MQPQSEGGAGLNLTVLQRPPSPGLLKWVLAGLAFGGSLLLVVELLLIRHYTAPLQPVALGAAGVGLMASFVPAATQNRVARVVLLLVAAALIGAGAFGAVVHLKRNAEVTRISAPLEVLSGPYPALAPLALANVGLVIALAVWVSSSTARRSGMAINHEH
jgi:hypothetical protein